MTQAVNLRGPSSIERRRNGDLKSYKSLSPEWIQMERLSGEVKKGLVQEFEAWRNQEWMGSRVRLAQAIQELMGWRTIVTPVWLLKKYQEASCLFALEATQRTAFTNPRSRLSYFFRALGTFHGALRREAFVPLVRELLRRTFQKGKVTVATMKLLMHLVERMMEEKKRITRAVLTALKGFTTLPMELKRLSALVEALKQTGSSWGVPPVQVLMEAVVRRELEASG